MENINTGSVKIMNESKDKIKFMSILLNLSNGIKPTKDEDEFIGKQISKLNLLVIDTSYELKFEF